MISKARKHFIRKSGPWRFKFSKLTAEGKKWLILHEINGTNVFKTWSSADSNREDTIDMLIDRILENSANVKKDYDLMMPFLNSAINGWEYWGSGIPEQIYHYFK